MKQHLRGTLAAVALTIGGAFADGLTPVRNLQLDSDADANGHSVSNLESLVFTNGAVVTPEKIAQYDSLLGGTNALPRDGSLPMLGDLNLNYHGISHVTEVSQPSAGSHNLTTGELRWNGASQLKYMERKLEGGNWTAETDADSGKEVVGWSVLTNVAWQRGESISNADASTLTGNVHSNRLIDAMAKMMWSNVPPSSGSGDAAMWSTNPAVSNIDGQHFYATNFYRIGAEDSVRGIWLDRFALGGVYPGLVITDGPETMGIMSYAAGADMFLLTGIGIDFNGNWISGAIWSGDENGGGNNSTNWGTISADSIEVSPNSIRFRNDAGVVIGRISHDGSNVFWAAGATGPLQRVAAHATLAEVQADAAIQSARLTAHDADVAALHQTDLIFWLDSALSVEALSAEANGYFRADLSSTSDVDYVSSLNWRKGTNAYHYSGVTYSSDLVAWWKCDDSAASTVLTDTRGSWNMILSDNANTLTTAAKVNNGIRLNSADDYAYVANWVWTTNYTMCCWLFPEGDAGEGGILANTWAPPICGMYRGNATTELKSFASASATWGPDASAAHDVLNTGVWYHVGSSYDGAVLRTWRNKTSVNDEWVGTPGQSPTTLELGRLEYGYLGGIVDEVQVYSRALTTNEMTDLYNSGVLGVATDITAVATGGDMILTVNMKEGAVWGGGTISNVTLIAVTDQPTNHPMWWCEYSANNGTNWTTVHCTNLVASLDGWYWWKGTGTVAVVGNEPKAKLITTNSAAIKFAAIGDYK